MTEEEKKAARDWQMLKAFLGTFDDEAQARGREELSEEDKEGLRQLASGELGEKEQEKLVPLLIKNELAMEFLAREIDGKKAD